MATEVIMPQMGESIAEGTITKWYKNVGDTVERDEPLFEISTDKVDTEIPSPVDGVLSEIRVGEGETVPIDTVVGVIGGEIGASKPSAPAATASAIPETTPAPTAPATLRPGAPSPSGMPRMNANDANDTLGVASASATTAPSSSAGVQSTEPLRSSPLVRKMAKEHGIDLTRVTGTGRGGRISKADVLSFLELRDPPAPSQPAPSAPPAAAPDSAASPSAPPASVTAQPQPTPTPPRSEGSASSMSSPEVPPSASTGDIGARTEIVPLSKMRRSIAEHMILSRRTSAHVTTVFEVDVSRIVQAREGAKARFFENEGVKLTYTPFFIRAVLPALRTFPELNASMDGENIHYHREHNIGVAVALDGGLIVPVVHHADEKSFLGLARSVADVATRARNKKLLPHEVQGGTFTITNPGPFGGLFGTPIINQPQVAILGVGGIHKRPVVVGDAIAVRSMVYLALSFDHRLVDGALGDQFMAEVKQRLENWDEAVL